MRLNLTPFHIEKSPGLTVNSVPNMLEATAK